jgi:tRNA-specific 2-thiouridylase
MGADYVATGHYATLRRPERSEGFHILIAKDKNKDQSYFLWTLAQKQLRHCLFPIGDYLKSEVRVMARKFGLPNAEKKDSQGICFLGQVTLKDFLGNYLPKKKGLVLNTAGKVVGEHSGAHFYTIGQRGGLGLGGQKNPVYIAEKDVEENALLVAEKGDSVLYRKEIILQKVNFINSFIPPILTNMGYKVLARVRYRQPLVKATLVKSQKSKVQYSLVFDKPQKFVASGQSAVFYQGNPFLRSGRRSGGLRMLGGGVID